MNRKTVKEDLKNTIDSSKETKEIDKKTAVIVKNESDKITNTNKTPAKPKKTEKNTKSNSSTKANVTTKLTQKPKEIVTNKIDSSSIKTTVNKSKTTSTKKTSTAKSSSATAKKEAKIKIDENKEFNDRFNKRFDELKWLYIELYENENLLSDLHNKLYDIYKQRSASLKAADREREKNIDWYKSNKIVSMNLSVELFNGNINGLVEKIPYLKEIGINFLHLTKTLKPSENKGNYPVLNSFDTNDKTDFDILCKALKRNSINLSIDFTMDHTSDEHDWAAKAKTGDSEFLARYMCFENYNIPSQYESFLPRELPLTAPGNFTYCEQIKKHIMTTFHQCEWDLNYHNPIIFNEMVCNILQLANKGVDSITLDGLPYLWKEIRTHSRNLPQVHSIVRMIRLITEIVCPGVILCSKTSIMKNGSIELYFGTKDKPECHLMTNTITMFDIWNSLATKDTRILKNNISRISRMEENEFYINYLRDYKEISFYFDDDEIRNLGFEPYLHNIFLRNFYAGKIESSYSRGEQYNYDSFLNNTSLCGTTASFCGLEKGELDNDKDQISLSIDRILLLHALIYSIPGLPQVNSGDEIGLLNDYSYKNDALKRINKNNIHLVKFNFDKALNRKKITTPQSKILSGIKNLQSVRENHPCFFKGSKIRLINIDDNCILAFARYFQKSETICIFNFSDSQRFVNILNSEGTNLMNKRKEDLKLLSLLPFEYKFIEVNK